MCLMKFRTKDLIQNSGGVSENKLQKVKNKRSASKI